MLRQFNCLLLTALIHFGRSALGNGIINGEKAPEDAFLYMASIESKTGHICGGFLISEDFVVTAAHCSQNFERVVLGTHNLKSKNKTVRNISMKCKHPLYTSVATGNDIMLLKLSSEVELGKNIQFIQIPSSEMEIKQEELCSVAGWGFAKTNGVMEDDLREVNVSVINLEDCKKKWPTLPSNVICAGGYETKNGFCLGDSGGPLVCNGTAVGVVSYNKSYNCKYPNNPNVYMNISKYLPWINKILKENKC
ncbi:duodenase-1-like [Aulostomus maculatus]